MLILAELVRETLEHEVPFYKEYWKETLDISPEELESERLSNIKTSYTSHELARGWEGTIVELVTALLPCAFVYWEMGKTMKGMCKLPEGHLYRNWIEFYTTGWYDTACEQLINLIDFLTENLSPREEARILEIFAVGCNYEYQSWHMYYNMERWQLNHLFTNT
jgi:thiaminase/transcriptional activator TenA